MVMMKTFVMVTLILMMGGGIGNGDDYGDNKDGDEDCENDVAEKRV